MMISCDPGNLSRSLCGKSAGVVDIFTLDELAEMAVADAEIEASFEITSDELNFSEKLDRLALGELVPCKKTNRDPEKVKRYRQAYYERNRESICEKNRNYWNTHKAQMKAYKRAYYLAHKEEFLERSRKSARKNKEKRKAYNREYYRRKKYGQSAIERDPAADQRAAAQA